MFVDNKAKQESAPENFFHHWNDDNETEETENDRQPIGCSVGGKNRGVEPDGTRRDMKELLRGDPEDENGERDCQGKGDIPQLMKFVAAAKPEQQRAAEDSLQRINPEFGMSEEKGLAAGSE